MEGWYKPMIAGTLAILSPIQGVLIATGALIFVDLVTGVWAAKVRGENITSSAIRRTVSKMLIFQIAIITGFIMEKYIIQDFMPVSKLVASVIALSEFTSILENTAVISGKDIFKELIKRLGSRNDQMK